MANNNSVSRPQLRPLKQMQEFHTRQYDALQRAIEAVEEKITRAQQQGTNDPLMRALIEDRQRRGRRHGRRRPKI